MAEARASASTAPGDPGGQLHPSLLGIAAAMEQSERHRVQRLGLAQEFLQNVDAWAKSKAGTPEAALLAPFIERIAPIVKDFAIGTAHTLGTPCKDSYSSKDMITTATRSGSKPAEKPNLSLPKKLQIADSPWVTVARKAARLPDPPSVPKIRKTTTQKIDAVQEPKKEDKRLFIRLGQEHEWRKLSPVTVKKLITEKAGIAASAIIAMSQVRSGLAIECASDALRETILGVSSSFQKDGIKIEPASDWTSVIVPHVPLFIKTLDQRITVTNEMVKTECQSVCGVTPVQVRPNKVKIGQYFTSWIVHFKQVPANLKFRLFDESGPAIPFSRRRPIEQCQRCWGFHSTRSCVKGQRCERCSGAHEKLECIVNIPKCANCSGPHESTNLDCMARPRRINGQITPRTPAELRVIRERGYRDFKAILAEAGKKGKAIEVISVPEEEMQINE